MALRLWWMSTERSSWWLLLEWARPRKDSKGCMPSWPAQTGQKRDLYRTRSPRLDRDAGSFGELGYACCSLADMTSMALVTAMAVSLRGPAVPGFHSDGILQQPFRHRRCCGDHDRRKDDNSPQEHARRAIVWVGH